MTKNKRSYATPEVLHDAPVRNEVVDADFHFDDFAATFARLASSKGTKTPLVIGINGAWGSGKTSLLMRVRKMLDETKVLLDPTKPAVLNFVNDNENPQKEFRPCRTVWFDAWKYNGEDQLFAALLRNILAEMQRDGFWTWLKTQRNKEEFRWFDLLADSLVQFASAGTFNPKIGDYRVETPLRQASAFFDYFDDSLTKLLDIWVGGKEKDGVLVIFVDDLDRCLPEKTVQVLEAMKLFLDKHGCIFFLGADADIVRQAVETHYKNTGIIGESAKDYLEKIIQLRFNLPPILDEAMAEYLKAQNVDAAMLHRWDALVAAAERNPRRVKSVINGLNLQWVMTLNAGQAQPDSYDDFICYHVAMDIAPLKYLERIQSAVNAPGGYEVAYQLLMNGIKWQQGSEKEKADVAADYKDFEGSIRLKMVFQRIRFSDQFTSTAFKSFYHSSAPPEKKESKEQKVESREERVEKIGVSAEAFEVMGEAKATRGGNLPAGDGNTLFIGGAEFKRVPAGKFIMGSHDEDTQAFDQEKPRHTIDIPYDYWLARFTVTNVDFEKFIAATNFKTTAEEQGSAYGYDGKEWKDIKGAFWRKPRGAESNIDNKGDHPVVSLSWLDAMKYCAWANEEFRAEIAQAGNLILRLPTEAEWEKTARGAYGLIYPWGNEFDPKRLNFADNSKMDTVPVGAYPNGASPYGCEQMAGNVWEWTHTRFEKYPYKVDDGREKEKASETRVLRGGAFGDSSGSVRCACRSYYGPSGRYGSLGFRLCVSPISLISGI
jgi:formylglycine-generating enzyme required for sulfatase activity